ncbi:MAG: DUF11 domain-containing protein [Deltaproteobacteria bacterium]|nr:DUF11 domain-containing protein [Deltaproteobacteria bacterium]
MFHRVGTGRAIAAHGKPGWARLLSLAILCFASFFSLAVPTFAQEVSITTSLLDAPGSTVPTGQAFRYRVTYSCNLVVGDCMNATVTVDLPPEVEFLSPFFPPGDVASGVHDGSPTGGTVTFTFQPVVTAGNTGDLDITVRFPNGSTPDGTTTTMNTDAAMSMGDPPLIDQMADLPPVTAIADPLAELDVSLQDAFLDSCQSPGPPGAFPSTYQVTIGPGSANGSLDFVDVDTLILTLPLGVDMVVPMDGGIFDGGANTVTWNNLGAVPVGGALTVSVELNFPQPPFNDGQVVTATAEALVDVLDMPVDPTLESFGPLDFLDTLQVFEETTGTTVSKAFADGRPAGLPPAEGQAFAYNVTIANSGNLDLDTLSVIDDGDGAGADIDPGIDITAVSTGTYSPPPTSVTINVLGDMGSTPSITSPDGSTNTTLDLTGGTLMPGERAIRIEWVFNGGAPAGMSPTAPASVDAVVNIGFPEGTTIDNHVSSSWTATPTDPSPCGGVVPPPTGGETGNSPLDVNGSYVYLRPQKIETSTGPYFPGDTASFTLEASNDPLANDPATGVILTDLLPAALEFQSGSESFAGGTTGVSLSTFEAIDNYNGTGRTLLRWTLSGDLDPSETVSVSFDTEVLLGVTFGNLTNEMGMTFPGGPTAQECAVGDPAGTVDIGDLDGDGDSTDRLCTASEDIAIGAVAQVSSRKLVRGQCDRAFLDVTFAPGTSLPGGVVDWQVEIQNVQTVPMENFVIVDIFPFVGDTGVKDPTPRLSLFRPLLIEPISPPPGGTVFYSLSGNPCRPEVGGPTSGCDAPNWTTIPPTPITAAQAIKVEFTGRVLNPLDLLTFEWRMVLPADAPIDGSEAFNSFAFGANRQDDGGFLSAEPNKVGIDATCSPIAPNDAMLGNFVWLDGDGNGLQEIGEAGVNDVPVQLFNPGPDGLPRTGDDILVLSSITADDALGNPGWYKFSALTPGNYYVQFTPPANFEVTVQDNPTDEALDSDADPESACTDVVTLGPSENNPDIDMGLLAPVTASLGNYVWFDTDGDGVQNEASTNGVNGVAVKLFVDDGDGTPEPGGQDGVPLQITVTANDEFGNPGFYLFEDLIPGTPYFVQFMLPPTATGFTTRNAGGNDTVDSDANTGNGTTPVVTLTPGEHNPTLDAGLVPQSGTLSLGNLVWCDDDGNGVIDAAGDNDGIYDPLVPEAPINGVLLNLYLDASGDGLPQVNEFFGSTMTSVLAGKAGRYRFDNLPAGDYIVEVDSSNFVVNGPFQGTCVPPGMQAVTVTGNEPTPDPDDDQDNDDSGDPAATSVISQAVTLAVGSEPTVDADDDLEADGDIHFALDFGFIPGIVTSFDFGDAPDSGAGTAQGNYQTVALDGGAFHGLLDPMGPYLGRCVDSDDGQQQNFTSDADDSGGALTITLGSCSDAGDDEDGVAFSTLVLAMGGTYDLTLTSSSPVPCLISGWIDWNRDGEFDDFAPEKVVTDVAAGAFPALAVPGTAVPGFTYARFRCSTAGGDGPIGLSPDGEVEDYLLQVTGADLGDAPDLPYGTLIGSAGPSHQTNPAVELYLGSCVDTDLDGQPSPLADGDDLGLGASRIGDCIDDEDGVTFDTMLVRGQMATITVTSSMAARLDGWVDLDGAGGFAGADQIITDQPVTSGANTFNFAVPANAAVGRSYARFRLSTAGGLGATGPAADGEVEDYVVTIKGFDFGDLPNPTYPTLLASGGAQHIVDPTSTLFLGACVDPENDGQPSSGANGDDLGAANSTSGSAGTCAGNDDEDGVTFDTMLIACQAAQITVSSNAAGRLDAWIDFNPTTAPGFGAGDQIATNMALGSGSNVLSFTVPCTADAGTTSYARFRLSSAGGLAAGGLTMDGEVEDYPVFLKGVDFGDAPNTYDTTFGSAGPNHGIDSRSGNEFVLGACGDTEVDGPAGGTATQDDGAPGTSTAGTCAATNDDEDGITFGGGMAMAAACSTGNSLTVALLNNAGVTTPRLDAWIDWNGDGDFDHPAEHLFAGTSAALTGPSTSLTYDVPCNAVAQGTSYSRFRLSSTGGLLPGGSAMNGEVEDYAFLVKGVDFGDAPDPYPTTFGASGPFHNLDPGVGLFLGACVDGESDGPPTAGADGDDLATSTNTLGTCTGNDDEDGVTFDTEVTACKSADITVTASVAGILDAWVDFDDDGGFGESGDQIFVSQPLAAGPNSLSFSTPCTAASGNLISRFRVSTAGGLTFTGPAADGEVEDHLVVANESDFGDAPDSYGTTEGANGASHGVIPSANLFLGSCVDTEDDGAPSPATGDDIAAGTVTVGTCSAANDDEDGVTFDTMIFTCHQATLTVTASTAGVLDAWLDFDGDNTFAGPSDQIFASQALAAGANVLNFTAPCDAVPRDTFARFRFSSAGGLGATGTASDGEVEDYAVLIKPVDFGDAPDTYGTVFTSGGPYHGIDFNGFLLGVSEDGEPNGFPTPGADGDDTTGAIPDDEDGITFAGGMAMGHACELTTLTAFLTNTAGRPTAFLDAWIDWNGNDVFDANEHLFNGTSAALAAGINTLAYEVPCSAEPGDSYARFRLSTLGGLGPNGSSLDGEVEDYPFLLKGLDWGDAPAPYPTLSADDGPRHILLPTGNPTLGPLVDDEADGQPNATHTGDDATDSDDEDGVTLPAQIIPGSPFDITVDAGTAGVLNAWIDYNGNGIFGDTPEEQVATDLALGAGTATVSSNAPPTSPPGTVCARFRYSSATGLPPRGMAPDGEVEDYGVEVLPEDPSIGVSKELVSITDNEDGTFLVLYTMRVQNFGNIQLDSIQVTTDLAEAYQTAVLYTVDSVLTSTNLTPNLSFDGDGDQNLLTGSDLLAVGEEGFIDLAVLVSPGNNPGPYECSAVAMGTSTAGTPVMDESQDGSDPDENGNGDPNDDEEPTVVTFDLFETVEIPTLGEWGLIIMTLMLMVSAAGLLRRRRI